MDDIKVMSAVFIQGKITKTRWYQVESWLASSCGSGDSYWRRRAEIAKKQLDSGDIVKVYFHEDETDSAIEIEIGFCERRLTVLERLSLRCVAIKILSIPF